MNVEINRRWGGYRELIDNEESLVGLWDNWLIICHPSKNHMHVIKEAPSIKVNIYNHLLLPGIENSSTITSEAAM